MKYKLGSIVRKNVEIVRFRDWEKKEGRYPITTILPPTQYPSGAFLFKAEEDDENIVYVKVTTDGRRLKDLLWALGFRKKRDREGYILYFVLEENGDYGIDGEENAEYMYSWTGKSWKLTKVQPQEEEVEF